MMNEAEHIFICILTVGLFSFVKYLLTSLPTFLLSYLFFSLILGGVVYKRMSARVVSGPEAYTCTLKKAGPQLAGRY